MKKEEYNNCLYDPFSANGLKRLSQPQEVVEPQFLVRVQASIGS
jgi:hypothetical protein